MNHRKSKPTTRRSLALDALRWAMASGLGLLSLRLTRQGSDIQENACIDAEGLTGCRSCAAWNTCRLPRALSVKRFLQKNNDTPKS